MGRHVSEMSSPPTKQTRDDDRLAETAHWEQLGDPLEHSQEEHLKQLRQVV
jgi:hypothetical protein